jgi:predicted dehydrogenase
MPDCGFPVIPSYLDANRDTLGIDGAKVTHIWTQDSKISEHCAAASKIDTVVNKMTDMIGQVDAILLARDDPENHVEMAKAFIDTDIPVFIDKPLAFCKKDLEYFTTQHDKGKFIMSSSAMRYSAGIQSQRDQLASIGQIKLVVAVGAKDLRKYAVHYIEGMLAFLGDPAVKTVKHVGDHDKDVIYIEMENGILATVHIFMGITDGELNIYGSKGALRVNHGGAYVCFRAQLIEAIRSFKEGRSRLDFAKTHNVVSTLIAARESLENGGKTITLK